jgi:hypothetical protein
MKIKFLAIFLLIGLAEAQEKLVAADHVPDAPSTRRFWSAENKIDLSIFAGQLAADAITTQRGLSEGFREVNPLMRPLVRERCICCMSHTTTMPSALRYASFLLERVLW